MFRRAGYRSPTLTICRNGLVAKNAKRRHGFCSEIVFVSRTPFLPLGGCVGSTI
jgi:hypothetical protein